MAPFTLLLRGINVGGSGRLPMADLRALLGELGCIRVATYIQSGNAVFKTGAAPAKLARRIEEEIERRHGFRRTALVLPAEAILRAHDDFPFREAFESPKTGHVWFLTGPASPDLAAMQTIAAPGERFALGPGTFNLHAPDGIGRSKLAQKAEELLGVAATARNLNTVKKLAGMLSELDV